MSATTNVVSGYDMTNGINGVGDVYARPNIELRGYDKRAKSPDTVIARMSAAASACPRALFYEGCKRGVRGETRADRRLDVDAHIMLDAGRASREAARRR